jgi:hypothetical protein
MHSLHALLVSRSLSGHGILPPGCYGMYGTVQYHKFVRTALLQHVTYRTQGSTPVRCCTVPAVPYHDSKQCPSSARTGPSSHAIREPPERPPISVSHAPLPVSGLGQRIRRWLAGRLFHQSPQSPSSTVSPGSRALILYLGSRENSSVEGFLWTTSDLYLPDCPLSGDTERGREMRQLDGRGFMIVRFNRPFVIFTCLLMWVFGRTNLTTSRDGTWSDVYSKYDVRRTTYAHMTSNRCRDHCWILPFSFLFLGTWFHSVSKRSVLTLFFMSHTFHISQLLVDELCDTIWIFGQ